MKKRVLIVEDDKFFRFAVKKCILWEKYGFELIGEAVHGAAALEFLKNQRVEVVITDMSMPVMNGIELTAAIKEKYPEIMIIALSAYDDFSFVKESLKLGASDYILKQDIEKEDVAKIIEDNWKTHLMEQAKDSQLKERVFGYLNRSTEKLGQREMDYLRLCVGDCKEWHLCMVENRNNNWKSRACSSEKWLEESLLEFHDRKWHLFFLASAQSPSTSVQREALRQQLNLIKTCLEEEKYRAGCSNRIGDLLRIQKGFAEAKQALQEGRFARKPEIGIYEECNRKKAEAFQSEAADYSDILSLPQAEAQLQQLTEEIYRLRPDEEGIIKSYLRLVSSVAANIRYDMNKLEFSELREQLCAAWLLEEMNKVVGNYIKNMFEVSSAGKWHVGITKSIQFMKQHYAQNITLGEIAECVAMNESYFSNLFKKGTGQSVVEYLNQIRIDRAKELLMETNMKNYEVGEAVGIPNASYFSTLFKKETGMTIQDYRQQKQKN